MKRLILICGANGIGKSTACKLLNERLDGSAFIDSDYCRCMNPFSFSKEEIEVVISNISNMMINYFRLDTINNVIFQYGFHGVRKQIFDRILEQLNENGIIFEFKPIILGCEIEENIRRMQHDNRDADRIRRAVINTRTIYDEYDYPRIDTTSLDVPQTVDKIVQILAGN